MENSREVNALPRSFGQAVTSQAGDKFKIFCLGIRIAYQGIAVSDAIRTAFELPLQELGRKPRLPENSIFF